MKPVKVTVLYDVAKEDKHNFLGRAVKAGEIFYTFIGHTYGCVRWPGIALSEVPGEYPFFEFPAEALDKIC